MNATVVAVYGLLPPTKTAASDSRRSEVDRSAALVRLYGTAPWLMDRASTEQDRASAGWNKVASVVDALGGEAQVRQDLARERDFLQAWAQADAQGKKIAHATFKDWRRENPHASLA